MTGNIRHQSPLILDIMIMIIILPFTAPAILTQYYTFDTILLLMKLLSIAVFSVLMIVFGVRVTPQIILFLSIILYMLLLALTKRDAGLYSWAGQSLTIAYLGIVFSIERRELFYKTVKILFWILFFETLLNFTSQFLFPHGIYRGGGNGTTICYILGMENRFVFTYITCLSLGLVLRYIDIKYAKYLYIAMLVATASLVKAWSVGAMLGLMLFDVVVIFSKRFKHIINGLNTTLVYVLCNTGLVFFRIQERFSRLLDGYLHKDVSSLTGRTTLWDLAIKATKENLFLGYGWMKDETVRTFFQGLSHPHNEMLNLLFQGGLIGLTLYILFIVSCLIRARKHRGTNLYCELLGAYFSLMIMLLADSWTSTSYFFIIFIIISNIDMICSIKKEKNTAKMARSMRTMMVRIQ